MSKVILVADDDYATRESLEMLLTLWVPGCQVIKADSASGAMAIVRERAGEINLLISDRNLGDALGDEVIKALKIHPQRKPDVKAILATGMHLRETEMLILRQAGMDEFWIKPTLPRDMRNSLQRLGVLS